MAISRLRSMAERFEREVSALALACRDPPRRLAGAPRGDVGADLRHQPGRSRPGVRACPGVLDDLIVLSLGLFVAVRLVPADVMAECRAGAAARPIPELRWWVVVLIVLAWQGITLLLASWWRH